MLHTMPAHHVEQMHARLERTHHARCRFMEHPIGNMIEQMTFELEIDDEINASLIAYRCESPSVCQVLQRPLDGAHKHLPWPVQGDLAREAFLEWAEPDDKVGDDLSPVLLADTCATAPRHERGIVLHVCHH